MYIVYPNECMCVCVCVWQGDVCNKMLTVLISKWTEFQGILIFTFDLPTF